MSPILGRIYGAPGGTEALDVLMKYMYVLHPQFIVERGPRPQHPRTAYTAFSPSRLGWSCTSSVLLYVRRSFIERFWLTALGIVTRAWHKRVWGAQRGTLPLKQPAFRRFILEVEARVEDRL